MLCVPAWASAQAALDLAGVLARAREQAPQIVSARLAVGEAQGRLTGASLRQQMNPDVDLVLGNRDSGAVRWTEFQIGAAQTFEPSGRRAARIAGAQADVDSSAAGVDAATREVLLQASFLYYQAIYAAERLRLLGASQDIARSIYDVADRRFRGGDLAVLDVNLARAALARARAERAAGEAEQAAVLGSLRALLRFDAPLVVRGDLTEGSPPDPVTLAVAVAQRPELRVLEAGVREAEAEVALSRTYSKPNYGLGLRYQREGIDHIVMGGFSVTLPVFSKGQEFGATGIARAGRLRAELEAARSRVRIELQAALDAYSGRVAAARTLAADAIPGLEETDALTTRSFDVGQIGLPDVLSIRRELLETRSQYLSAQLEVARARVTVDAAAGVLR